MPDGRDYVVEAVTVKPGQKFKLRPQDMVIGATYEAPRVYLLILKPADEED